MTDLYYPLRSLREGRWFKLICGASFQHLPAIRNLVLAYTLAGADCIDVAADSAVVSAARAALDVANDIAAGQPGQFDRATYDHRPWLMVSLNDGEDPHFRKAEFDPAHCPAACSRPCEAICPAQAIVFPQAIAFPAQSTIAHTTAAHMPIAPTEIAHFIPGVQNDRCYGCGRCLPVCPIQQIVTRSYVSTPTAIAPLVLQAGVDAIEIHTQVGRLDEFRRLWAAIVPWLDTLKLVAVSCPDGAGLIDYLWALHEVMSPLPCPVIWQTDGRPMSGDLGMGTTRAAIKLGQTVLAAGLPGYVQLAGGTNAHTVPKLRSLGLLRSGQTGRPHISGVAYGSYARSLLLPVLNQLEVMQPVLSGSGSTATLTPSHLEDYPELLRQAVSLADSLVSPLKLFDVPCDRDAAHSP